MTTGTDTNAAPAPRLPFPLQADERVLALVRRHWIHLWPRITFYAIIAVVPLALVGWFFRDTGIAWIVALVWAAFWAVRALLAWYQFHHDIWVVTNQRIVDSIRTTPFSLKISTADLVNIQDMSIDRSGIVRTVLDFGDIICQTAADNQQFRLSGIADPRAIQALVDRERDRERTRGR